ncbi:putative inositol-1,4,5-trisphosphate (IP3) 5-phosphatase [Trypanosoma conorhini]|uniref:inositol-polyphosphate 5-phosphatase n=1 Tax=Trypanosoma conorhini TaxID=83891 RepID=A0A3R7LJ73_9TRYP|nr:putative inositol-1,4,5-trisphosphate (IP3) 5-phosphatase [Trypanosoma conorhini]RNF25671.1 putative inositol-1,4,5-trisphosphate (IP3) 5-phosphatase [Trypanosoma conorhini]
MRSLLDGITSALRVPQMPQREADEQQQPPGSPGVRRATAAAAAPSPRQKGSTGAKATGFPAGALRYQSGSISCAFAAEKSPDLPFTMLLLTQNVGGLWSSSDGTSGEGVEVADGAPAPAPKTGVSDSVRRRVAEFLQELRLLIYEASRREFASHLRRDKVASEGSGPPSTSADGSHSEVPPLLDVIVVHFQEIGGKEAGAESNALFAEALRMLLPEAAWSSGLLMEANNDAQRFTALGTIVFLAHRMCPISSILSLRHRTFVAVADDPATYCSSPTFLFHGGKFSGAASARKGYLLTSLRFGTVVVNFLNLHLYHDDRNTEAAAASPSVYAARRQEALLEAVAECMVFVAPQDPLFIFGDFNTRLDTHSFLKHLKETRQMEVQLSAKDVQAPDCFWELFTESQQAGAMKKFDVELQRLMDVVAQQSGVELAEFAIRFPPTYSRLAVGESMRSRPKPKGDVEGGEGDGGSDDDDDDDDGGGELKKGSERGRKAPRRETGPGEGAVALVLSRITAMPTRGYSRQRVPAWCDRVVWNPAGLELMTGQRSASSPASLPSASSKSDGPQDSSSRYAYRSFALAHTDHDCVALLF